MYFHYYGLDGEPPPQKTDRERLYVFLDDVKSFLSRLTKHPVAFVHGLYDDVVQAWRAAESRFDDAKDELRKVSEGELERAGLVGAELKLKLRNVEHAFGELITMLGGDTLRRFFGTINNLLKSLADAAGFGTALEEIKDAIRDALAWSKT